MHRRQMGIVQTSQVLAHTSHLEHHLPAGPTQPQGPFLYRTPEGWQEPSEGQAVALPGFGVIY